MKIYPVGGEVLQTDRQMNIHEEANSCFPHLFAKPA